MSCCKRTLGLSYKPVLRGQLGIDYGGRRVTVTCSQMAIDTARVDDALASDEVRSKIIDLRQKYTGKIIFAGCDTIERLKGIPLKMLAFNEVITDILNCLLLYKNDSLNILIYKIVLVLE